ncbi:hypothetical protein Poli38472_011242 [Pythium oligandrum]|uniref:Elicitin n=1 Tax=Pythium oligandrum TaxID=41045 RepID=A0A8K1FQ65_PYTOL|nr:hypothetical protein Poli38472_011242 [Pythium oligandrum]|eukprot:TMW67622.1 hypothetical protein Poli38472_011242 [Pythium oligandrum]
MVRLLPLALMPAVAVAAQNLPICDLSKLEPLVNDTDFEVCPSKSGLVFPPPTKPTDADLATVCRVPECVALVQKVMALDFGECLIGSLRLEADLLIPLGNKCVIETKTPGPDANLTSSVIVDVEGELVTGSASGISLDASGSKENDDENATHDAVTIPAATDGASTLVHTVMTSAVAMVLLVACV